jgi:hypothetical protein
MRKDWTRRPAKVLALTLLVSVAAFGSVKKPLPTASICKAPVKPAPITTPAEKAAPFENLSGPPALTAAQGRGKRPEVAQSAPPAPEIVTATTLWNQPQGNVDGLFDSVCPDNASLTSYIADDFTNAVPWTISTIYVPMIASTSIANATSLTWSIYPVSGPTPPGYPGSGPAPTWTLTLPPSDPQISIAIDPFYGTPGDVTLNLTSPFVLPAGNWWFECSPTMNLGSFGPVYWQSSLTSNGSIAQWDNVGGGFGVGTGWVDVSIEYAYHDQAFRLDGLPCTPGNLNVNDGSFENVPSAWTEWDSAGYGGFISAWGSFFGVADIDGPTQYWAGGYVNASPVSSYVEQSITLPASSFVMLNFETMFDRLDPDDPGTPDTFYVNVNGTPVFTKDMSVANNTFPNWTQQAVDLTAYQGQTVTLRIGADSQGTTTGNVLVDKLTLLFCCPTITLSPATLPTPIQGVPYSQVITASGGNGPYTFAVTSGTLPAGLTLAPGGTLSGTMTALAPSGFTITATDAYGCTGSQVYSTSTFSAFFKDDFGRSLMCVNRLTGAYTYQILSGPGVGVYTGTCVVMNGGAKYVNQTGAANKLNVTYDPVRRKASGYFINAANAYSALSDANTANNTGGCP